MSTTRVNSVDQLRALNHNPLEGKKQMSKAHQGGKWASVNSEVGANCVRLLDLSFISGIFSDYLHCFQDQENPVARFFVNLFNAVSGGLFGKREEDMYTDIYARGLDLVSPEDYNDQKRMLEKTSFLDDYFENAHFLKDKVINAFWRGTTRISQISPVLFFTTAFFGRKWSDFIFSMAQTPSRGTWRLTYLLAPVFHGNFVETSCKFLKLKLMSLVSPDAKRELAAFTGNLEKMAYDYAKIKYPKDENVLEGKKGTDAYRWMLADRLHQHKRGIQKPDEVLKEKIDRGNLTSTTEKERKANPEDEKTLENGYADPDSPEDKAVQRRTSIVSYTALPCAVIGLVGTFVGEPLRCLWDLTGLQRGKSFLSFLANIRGPASLFNYLFKFFRPEIEEGKTYKNLESQVKDGTANEAIQQLYQSRKGRLINGYLGVTLLAASFVDSFGQFFRSNDPQRRAQNFLFSTVSRIVGTGFVRFFSARRRDLGRDEQIYLACEEILGTNLKSKDDKELVQAIKDIDDTVFLEKMKSIGDIPGPEKEEKVTRIYDPFLEKITGLWGSFMDKVLVA